MNTPALATRMEMRFGRFRALRSFLGAACLILPTFPLFAQDARQQIPLSGPSFAGSWQFFGAATASALPAFGSSGFNSGPFQDVYVPHVYQTRLQPTTVQAGWYKLNYTVPADLAGKHLYLVFEGAAAISDVYVNSQHLGQHRGAYTRFTFDATAALTVGANNVIAVRVDNDPADTADCLPSNTRLYTVWGGLYRHVWLLATDPVHIDPTDSSSPGIYITPTGVTATSASLSIQALVRNTLAASQSVQVQAVLQDPAGATVATYTANATVPANQRTSVTLKGTVSNPQLWAPGAPNVYHVVTSVIAGGQTIDAVTQPTGFRSLVWSGWVSKSSGGVVALNGKAILLRGADLHQEIETKFSAVEDSDLQVNFGLMQDLGVNWVRFSHYPRAQYEYDQCDQLGILCWTENGHTNPDEATSTADTITTEWVKQNYNHPSIAVWSVGNEAGETVAEREVPIVKALDPTRDVVVANMTCKNADFIANNTYPGWYGGDRWKMQSSGYITENGAGGVVTTHTDYTAGKFTVNSYEPEEYQQLVAEARFQTSIKNNSGKLGMFTWWVLRDITDVKYKSPVGLNTKGLVTYAADPKDSYYLFRCFLRSDVRTVHLTSKRYFLRKGSATNGVKAYSNAPSLTLTLNGQVVSTLNNGKYAQNDSGFTGTQTVNNVFYWPVQMHTGANTLSVSDGAGNTDSAVVYFYGSGGLATLPVNNPLVTSLTSSNSSNPAYYMNMPVQAQWPIYYDLDSTADNSFNDVPAAVQGATWIATHRVTKSGMATALGFTVTGNATIYVMCTKTGSAPAFLTGAGFTETADAGLVWRDNNLNLVPAQLFSRQVTAGQAVTIPAADRDALVMFQGTGESTQQASAPAFSPGGGNYSSPQTVTITSATGGASIRYTTDGSTPSETAGTLYSSPVSISSSVTLNAIAYENGFTDSPVTTAAYSIGSGGPPPTVNLEAESLSPVGTGATVSISNDANASGGVVEFLNSTAAGQTITFTTPSIPPGTYQVQLRYKSNTTRGQHTVKVDGVQVGGTIDQYATTSAYTTATLGNVTFGSTATHTIVMTVTGKNSAATQFYLTADKFTFVGQ
ncbi:MAG TPA: glycoside hydrolase family 2 TIM barrel-domain containing protein [Opitutaceae bacterium]|jgi:beta-galactosidase|nr:glycoside hydrolase family 2 TIM barrel-domain containing protein [Opitutaceae bacterium]